MRLNFLYLFEMPKAEFDARMDESAEFTEFGSFLVLPIRAYSARMRPRPTYAVSASIQADIRLLDEASVVGEAAFFAIANRPLQAFTDKAAIIVLAPHPEGLVKKMCRIAVLMEHGRVIRSCAHAQDPGEPQEAGSTLGT